MDRKRKYRVQDMAGHWTGYFEAHEINKYIKENEFYKAIQISEFMTKTEYEEYLKELNG